MGKVYKNFVASVGHRRAIGSARVDTGADVTMLKMSVAKKLGLNPLTAPIGAVYGVGDQRVSGFHLPIKILVGKSSAEITAFVPAGIVIGSTLKETTQKHNLLGIDFLQATRVKLDYSQPHEDTFIGEVELTSATEEEYEVVRAWATKKAKKKNTRKY